MMMSLDFPERMLFMDDLKPRVYLPLFMTKPNLELMDSRVVVILVY